MDSLLNDLRFALRSLMRRPGFAIVVALTLAIGIGANSAIFSIVNGVLLRPLPYREPERLVMLWTMLPEFGREVSSLPDFRDWREGTRSFADVAALSNASFGVTGEGEPERVEAASVTANFFRTAGVALAQGRSFTREEERENSRLAIVSHGFWQRRLGGRAGVIGETVRLSGTPYEIVGVAPEGFRLGRDAQLWVPLNTADPDAGRRSDFLTVIARLAPGVTLGAAQREMTAIMSRLGEQYPQTNARVGAQVTSLREEIVGKVRPALLVFMGAVGLVLLIACANVANLLLARAAAREREIAVRAALGAGHGRIVRQLLTESVALALAGAAIGLVLATWGVGALRRADPSNLPRIEAIAVDGRVVAFTVLVSLAVGVLFGLAPALRLARGAIGGSLRDGARTLTGGHGLRSLRGMLVLSEVAVAILLLAGAGLLIRSFDKLQRVEVGVDPEGVLTAFVVPPQVKYDSLPQVALYFERLLDEVRRTPNVRVAAIGNDVPVSGGASYWSFSVEGRPAPAPGTAQDVQPYIVSPEYFQALGIPLVRGRALAATDRQGAVPVALVNQAMARKFFAGEEVIGKRITFDGTDYWSIVGVVGDTRQEGLTTDPYPQVYVPFAQRPRRGMALILRTAGDPLAAVPALKQVMARVDPEIALSGVASMRQLIDRSIAQPRVNTVLLGAFAGIALLLAAVGIYGVTAYGVAQRTREIGVRMALGARPRDVLGLVVRQGMLPVAVGTVVGLLAALAGTRVMRGLLFGIEATDPLTFTAIPALLALVALAASILPARRAARVDPMVALKEE